MTTKLMGIYGIAAAVFTTTAAHAVPITGTLSMGGELNLDSADYATATQVTSWPLVYVVADSDSFSSISAFTQVTMSSSPWVFSPAPGVAQTDLWNVGGFTFDFLSDTVSASANFLDISGVGNISGNGYDSTAFTWNLSLEQPTTGGPSEFTFSATAGPSGAGGGSQVPDGGFTVAFLGLAMAGIEGLRRKMLK